MPHSTVFTGDKSVMMPINQPGIQNQIYDMNCTSYYNENNLCVCLIYGLESSLDEDKVVTLLQVVALQLAQIAILHNHNQVQVMVLVVCIKHQINLLNQEMIGHAVYCTTFDRWRM